MTFAVLTAKHESGFCLWGSQGYDYDLAHSPFKGDIISISSQLAKLRALCPASIIRFRMPIMKVPFAFGAMSLPPYFNVIKQHLAELHTKYPELRLLILDVSSRLSSAQLDELRRIVKRLNPQCSVWPSDKDGTGEPHYDAATVNERWMFSPNDKLNSAQQLFNGYQKCQSAGKAFVLNVGPAPSGLIPGNQIAVLMELKTRIANSPAGSPSHETTGAKPPLERLKQVKALYDQGLINKEDYDHKVKEIMDSL